MVISLVGVKNGNFTGWYGNGSIENGSVAGIQE